MARKGITAVVAIVLLLMMTVAAAGLAYMWVGGLQQGAQQTGTEGVGQIKEQTQTALSIDSMWSSNATNSSSGNISFTLRNSGTFAFDDLSKLTLYVDGQNVNNYTGPLPSVSGPLAPKEVKTIGTNITYPTVGTPKILRFVTPNGIEVLYKRISTSITRSSC